MTPDATVRVLTNRHERMLDELEGIFGDGHPVDALISSVEHHRTALHLSAYWLLDETSASPALRRRFVAQTKRLQDRLRTLRILDLRGRSMRKETRRILRAWLDTGRELAEAAAGETTNAGRELLVRAYRRGDQLARRRTVSSVPAELD